MCGFGFCYFEEMNLIVLRVYLKKYFEMFFFNFLFFIYKYLEFLIFVCLCNVSVFCILDCYGVFFILIGIFMFFYV